MQIVQLLPTIVARQHGWHEMNGGPLTQEHNVIVIYPFRNGLIELFGPSSDFLLTLLTQEQKTLASDPVFLF